MELPELIVFDLDFTLWSCGGTYCDCLTPPFKSINSKILDANQKEICLYDDIRAILENLKKDDVTLALASRTEEPIWARKLLELLNINSFFTYLEIFPACKTNHFRNIQKSSNIPYRKMLFFDDELRNINDVSSLGVTCIFTENGLNQETFLEGLKRFQKK